jgi:HPt (histidine-containing phosphotransfer) domain-containing protein
VTGTGARDPAAAAVGQAFSYVGAKDAVIVLPGHCENRRQTAAMRSKSSDLARELEAILAAARAEFMSALPQRIASVDALLADVACDDAAAREAALSTLRSEMHRIAGIGGSIGLRDLSVEATRAEEVLRPLATGAAPVCDGQALAEAAEAVQAVRDGLLRLSREHARGEA